MKKKILCTMMSMVMAASLFAGCGTGTGTETSASDNSKTEETGTEAAEQPTSDNPYAAYAGTTISVAAIETGYGSQMWQEVTDAFTEETGIQVELTTDKKWEVTMKKKILCTMMSMVMAASLFAGCGTGTGTETSASDNSKTEETGTEAAEQPTSDNPYAAYAGTTISVAAIETGYGSQMWQEVTDAFTEETGIQVELTTDKKLEDVIGPSMQGGEYPDVIHLATGREAALTEQFIKGNMITDITDVLSMKVPGEDKLVSEKIAGGFTDTSLTNPYGDGKTYLAPMFYSPCGLFYNAGLLEEKGWDVPTTWDEMWELGDKAKEEGIYLFTYPTTGYFDAFFYALMYAAGGSEFFDKATNYEEGIWETPEAQTCFDIVAKLAEYTNPITPAQANDQDFTQNQQLVLDNKAIFMPNGTWIVGEMADAPRADGFKWGMTALPAVKAGGDSYSYTWFEQAWIPSGAEHQDAAKLFISYLYSDKACEIFAKAGAIQPVLGIADKLEGDNVMFYSIYDNGAKAAMGNFASFEAIPGIEVRTVFFDPVNSLVSGDMTEQEWIDGIISASDQMRANLK